MEKTIDCVGDRAAKDLRGVHEDVSARVSTAESGIQKVSNLQSLHGDLNNEMQAHAAVAEEAYNLLYST